MRSILKGLAIALIAIGIVAGIGAFATVSMSDPECNGKPLRPWQYCVEDGKTTTYAQQKEEHDERVRTLGWTAVALLAVGTTILIVAAVTDRPVTHDHVVEHRPSDAEMRAAAARQAQQRRRGP